MKSTFDIIKKMLTKELDVAERQQLSETKRMEAILRGQWNETSDRHIQDKVDHTEIWDNITAVCWGKKRNLKSGNKRYLRIGYSLAAVALIVLIGVWIAKSVSDSYITIKAPAIGTLTYTLPDGSAVWLNAGSEIQYPSDFMSERKVKLNGEAFFDVVKLKGSAFSVNFHEECVEVKGTEFNIKSNMEQAEITLFSGKVIFSGAGLQQKFEMKPSDRIVYDRAAKRVSLEEIDLQEYDWRSTEYRFQNKPLGELINFMSRIYKVNILVKDTDCEKVLFTGVIRKTESLSDVLAKICISFDLKLNKSGNDIVLY